MIRSIDIQSFLDAFTPDVGTLPDCEATEADPGDWQSALDAVRARGWRLVWRTDDGEKPVPSDVTALRLQANTVAVWPNPGVRIHFFPTNEAVLFDFDLREITDQAALDALTDFLRTVARSIQKSITISYEGDGVAFMFNVDQDQLVRVP